MFGQYCAVPFQVEQVRVIYPDGSSVVTPDLSCRCRRYFDASITLAGCACLCVCFRPATARVDEIQSILGVPLEPSVIVSCLNRMQLKGVSSARGDTVTVSVPPMRSDVLHECDVVGAF